MMKSLVSRMLSDEGWQAGLLVLIYTTIGGMLLLGFKILISVGN